jgi:hypothetical protein
MSTGTADQIMNTRKKKEYRILPVASAMSPTMSGPKNELDCFVHKRSDHKDSETIKGELTLSVIEYSPNLVVGNKRRRVMGY